MNRNKFVSFLAAHLAALTCGIVKVQGQSRPRIIIVYKAEDNDYADVHTRFELTNAHREMISKVEGVCGVYQVKRYVMTIVKGRVFTWEEVKENILAAFASAK